jgi:DNA polymerase-1
VDEAVLGVRLWACFGWQIHIQDEINDRSLRNFPMQANDAEMLRIACILLTEAGVRVCAPVHDALLQSDAVMAVSAIRFCRNMWH